MQPDAHNTQGHTASKTCLFVPDSHWKQFDLNVDQGRKVFQLIILSCFAANVLPELALDFTLIKVNCSCGSAPLFYNWPTQDREVVVFKIIIVYLTCSAQLHVPAIWSHLRHIITGVLSIHPSMMKLRNCASYAVCQFSTQTLIYFAQDHLILKVDTVCSFPANCSSSITVTMAYGSVVHMKRDL